MNSLVKLNATLLVIVLLIISSIFYSILKYHIVGFGSFADIIIAIANVIMALAACLGVKSAREWLKKREQEEIFNKRQKITENILIFTMLSSRTRNIIKMINDKSEYIKENSLNENIIKMMERQFTKIESAWEQIVIDKESMTILARGKLEKDIHTYFDSVRNDANSMIRFSGLFLSTLMWRWEEKDLDIVKGDIKLIADNTDKHYKKIQIAYDEFAKYQV
ncbi:hypothetical protein [Serratia aquatilis]|uniref:DUF4760 domain-containing protein n=1 Tax=Serratia aquatilis TaxID=1737515 RepID=A0ABV6EEH3_9GAMM